jgi:hypothetical protein
MGEAELNCLVGWADHMNFLQLTKHKHQRLRGIRPHKVPVAISDLAESNLVTEPKVRLVT